MRHAFLLAAFLVTGACTTLFAQQPATANTYRWKARLRGIAAIPASSSYTLQGSDVKISTSVVPELDFSYYFNRYIAGELILGTTRHTVKLADKNTSTNLGKVWLLPPTLTLQFHLPLGNFEPYAGAGVNYTVFYGAKDEGAALQYRNRFGFATQLGADYRLGSKWFVNVDAKKILLKTDVTVGEGAAVLQGVKINPWIIGVGVGTQF